jgi:hypothetical protein
MATYLPKYIDMYNVLPKKKKETPKDGLLFPKLEILLELHK